MAGCAGWRVERTDTRERGAMYRIFVADSDSRRASCHGHASWTWIRTGFDGFYSGLLWMRQIVPVSRRVIHENGIKHIAAQIHDGINIEWHDGGGRGRS